MIPIMRSPIGQNILATLGANLTDGYINFNAQGKLLAMFCYLQQPAFSVESLKPCCNCSMKSFREGVKKTC